MRFGYLIIGLLSILSIGCSKQKDTKNNQHAVLLLGAESNPEFQSVVEGEDLIANKQIISVSGHGDLGLEEWGALHYTYTNGDSYTFKKGGVVAWSPPGEKFEKISGEAKIDLFAYLLTAEADENLTPSSMVVQKKWRIPKGSFDLEIEGR